MRKKIKINISSEAPLPKLKEFEPWDMKINYACCLIAKRGSGKSTLMKDILFCQKERYDTVYIFSDTNQYENEYPCIPKKFRIQGYNEVILDKIIKFQINNKKLNKEDKTIPINHALVILDDITKKDLFNSAPFIKLANQGRHMNISFVVAVQRLVMMEPSLRVCMDYVFTLFISNNSEKDVVIKEYYDISTDTKNSLDRAYKIFHKYIDGYKCLVKDDTKKTYIENNTLFYYEAEKDLPKFKLCDSVHWEDDYDSD